MFKLFFHFYTDSFQDGVPDSPSESSSILEKIIRPLGAGKGSSNLLSPYPLDPLTALEIRTAALIIRAANQSLSLQFKCIGLREPEKALLLPYFLSGTVPPAGSIERKADVLVVDAKSQAPAWVVVNLNTFEMESWTDARPDQHAATITLEDQDSAEKIALSDPRVIQKINALGFNDLSKVVTDVW